MLATAALLLTSVGCRTTEIGPPVRISVPSGLSNEDTEVAIVAMLTAGNEVERKEPTDPNTHTLIIANPIGAMLLDAYRTRAPSKGWFVESWDRDRIFAGYQQGSHYLRILIAAGHEEVVVTIVDSKNLKQSSGRIHRSALEWVNRLEVNIRDALGRASLLRRREDVSNPVQPQGTAHP
jgi:hypothetical protein